MCCSTLSCSSRTCHNRSVSRWVSRLLAQTLLQQLCWQHPYVPRCVLCPACCVLCPAVLVPFIALFFGVYPLVLNRDFALAATLYFTSSSLVTSVRAARVSVIDLLGFKRVITSCRNICVRAEFFAQKSNGRFHCCWKLFQPLAAPPAASLVLDPICNRQPAAAEPRHMTPRPETKSPIYLVTRGGDQRASRCCSGGPACCAHNLPRISFCAGKLHPGPAWAAACQKWGWI